MTSISESEFPIEELKRLVHLKDKKSRNRVMEIIGQHSPKADHLENSIIFDTLLTSDSQEFGSLADALMEELNQVGSLGRMNRARRICLLSVLANLSYAHFTEDGQHVAYDRRSNAYVTRYDGPLVSYRTMTAIVDGLINQGFLEHHMGSHQRDTGKPGLTSRMRATEMLAELMERHDARPDKVHQIDMEFEVIWLKDADRHPISYSDTDASRAMRAVVERYNAALANTDIVG